MTDTSLQQGLKNRYVGMIAIGGVIGAGLFVGSGAGEPGRAASLPPPSGGSLRPGHDSGRRGHASMPEIATQLRCPRSPTPRQATGQRSRPPLRR
jgi:hypothetical protein